MESVEKKKNLLIYISIFLMILSINFFCISQKRGLFADEQMTIRDSNIVQSVYKDGFNDKYIPEKIYTGEQLKQMYLWNDSSIKDVFHDLGYLYIKNENRVHTNLYYSILRVWFSGVDFNDIDYFILKGCLLNIVFFCFAFFFMYKLLALLFDNDKLSVGLGLIVAFLNTGTLTNLIFIREYYLQMTMFIILSYFIVKSIKDYENNTPELTVKSMIIIAFVTALTLLSAFYSLFFVLFLYLWMAYKPLKNKDYTFLKHIGKTFCLSILFTIIIYPLYFTGFFSHHGLSEIQSNISMKWSFINYLAYLYNTILHHFSNFVFYYPVLLTCLVMIFLRNKKTESNKNKTNSNLLILCLLSFAFCILVILLQQRPFTYYRYMVAAYPLLTIIIPYFCNKKPFKAIFASIFIVFYLYAAIISPANSSEAKGNFYYAVKRYTYSEDRDIIDKMQSLNLPILIYENNTSWNKYCIIAYLKDKNIFCINNTDFIQKGQDFIMLLSDDKNDCKKPVPEFLKGRTPNIIIPESHFIGYILTKD